jgi:AraC family transcriptional regulator of adaptative response/methylated-DNA-[protein]-cysteine methyltransferase
MIKTLPTQSEMERASLARDAAYDGLFYVCVKSTGIFCRPSCGARKPKPENVEYHGSVRDCLVAGFRPCKRCRPLATNGSTPEWLGDVLARIEQSPRDRVTDADLRELGVDPHRARRYFQKHFDMTFQGYHRARRMGLALEQLRRGADPLMVAMDCGYDSNSGFREAFEKVFGATPGRSDAIVAIKTRTIETPVGAMLACATDEGVCLLEFADRRALQKQLATLKRRFSGGIVPGTNGHLDRLVIELAEYFDGGRRGFTIPLVAPGTPFQESVWRVLQTIPCGEEWSYERVARAIGAPQSRRAVARANGDNRIAILIPCHRVIRADGTLSGYGGGVWRKQFLLDLEIKGVGQPAPCPGSLAV